MSRGANVTGAISRLFLAVISCFHALPQAFGGYAFTVHSLIFTAFDSVVGVVLVCATCCHQFLALCLIFVPILGAMANSRQVL